MVKLIKRPECNNCKCLFCIYKYALMSIAECVCIEEDSNNHEILCNNNNVCLVYKEDWTMKLRHSKRLGL